MRIPRPHDQGLLVYAPNDTVFSFRPQSPSGAVEARFGSLVPNLSGEVREGTVGIGMGMENNLDCSLSIFQGVIAVKAIFQRVIAVKDEG